MGLSSSRRLVALPAVALLVLLLASASDAKAQVKKSDSVVKVSASADKPDADGKQTVTITLDIESPWHLYANPVDNEDLANAQTVILITGKAKPEEVKIDYPAGKQYVDRGIKYNVYEGKVAIKAHVKRAKDDSGPLEVSVKLQACDKSKCLIPATVKVSVP
jgi:DsbC/DsbD-like thiol-disulfide interchange protein